ncbi:hypothetical protein BV22DRAFT_1049269 [Leucogyrophana mollusca]|uniref:Uncharacterized protein n=1 Tax=Leucogyrophana mollusca TaxID=85980 RepID=A0ACB8B8N9_9AGAM|nr:hypothetical protein BV22DRAFT_1049269 [Leucogyrophana mollusca]
MRFFATTAAAITIAVLSALSARAGCVTAADCGPGELLQCINGARHQYLLLSPLLVVLISIGKLRHIDNVWHRIDKICEKEAANPSSPRRIGGSDSASQISSWPVGSNYTAGAFGLSVGWGQGPELQLYTSTFNAVPRKSPHRPLSKDGFERVGRREDSGYDGLTVEHDRIMQDGPTAQECGLMNGFYEYFTYPKAGDGLVEVDHFNRLAFFHRHLFLHRRALESSAPESDRTRLPAHNMGIFDRTRVHDPMIRR